MPLLPNQDRSASAEHGAGQLLKRRISRTISFISGAAWLYPLTGVYYFLSHSFLWPLMRARLLPCFLLSLFVYVNLFLWAYLPQVAFLRLFHPGQSAWVNATFLVLEEGAVITALLFEAFLVDETLVDVFDAVLVAEGLGHLVEESRPVDADAPNPRAQLGRPYEGAAYLPFSFIQIVELIVLLPLNFIPFVGIPAYLLVTGRRAGPLHHSRYFTLLEWSKKDRKDFVKKRQLRYTWFGTMALLLDFIPPFNMLLLFSTAAGSALWVRDLEAVRRATNNPHMDDERYVDDEP